MRPRVAPGVLAELLAAAPARVRKRLDADPGAADGWPWEHNGDAWKITAGGETVRLTAPGGAVTEPSQVSCSCLLAPRCLHLLSVLSALDLAMPDPAAATDGGDPGTGPDDPRPPASPAAEGSPAGTAPEEPDADPAVAGGPAATSPASGGRSAATGTVTPSPASGGRSAATGPAAGASAPAAGASAPTPGGGPAGTVVEVRLDARQRAAAALAWEAGARLLGAGAGGAGSLVRGELLRAAHACQDTGLHRLGAAAIRVASGAHALAADRPEFDLGGLAADLAELLSTAWRLGANSNGRDGLAGARPAPTIDDVGVGRRRYEPVGALHLHGVLSQAVVAGSGYAGVVTYLMDTQGRLWSVSDVTPGEPDRAPAAYRGAVRFGQLSLQHRELSRSRVIAQGATGTTDGRLGSGKSVAAVRGGPSSWDRPPLADRFTEPVEDQLDRVWQADGGLSGAVPGGPSAREATTGTRQIPSTSGPPGTATPGRREGYDLVFIDALVEGTVAGGLVLLVRNARSPLAVLGVAPSDHDQLQYLPNLNRLAEHAGTGLRLVGRVRLDRPRTVALLAAGPPASPGPDTLVLPQRWEGRINLGFEDLAGGHLAAHTAASATAAFAPAPGQRPAPPGSGAVPPEGEPAGGTHGAPTAPATSRLAEVRGPSPLDGLRRVLLRAVAGGRPTLGVAAATTLAAEVAALRRAHLPTAAELLDRLAAAGMETRRTLTGERCPPPPDRLARIWTSSMTYLDAANRHLLRAAWTTDPLSPDAAGGAWDATAGVPGMPALTMPTTKRL